MAHDPPHVIDLVLPMRTGYVSMHLEKTADDWGPDGAAGKHRGVMYEHTNATVANINDERQVKNEISAWLAKYGLELDVFQYDENEAGHFSYSRIEDEQGNAHLEGKYLADYNLQVTLFITEPKRCGTFGLKSQEE